MCARWEWQSQVIEPDDRHGWSVTDEVSEDLAEGGATASRRSTRGGCDLLPVENLEARVDRIDRFTSLADVVERFEEDKHGAAIR
jgi:hypothetical protein